MRVRRSASTWATAPLLSIVPLLTVALLMATGVRAEARSAFDQLKTVSENMVGLLETDQDRLTQALRVQFRDVDEMDPKTFASVQGIINAGLFEMSENTGDEDGPLADGDIIRVAKVTRATYQAIVDGAEPRLAEDLALVGFAHDITAGQIEASAKALARFMETTVDPFVYQEIISQAMDSQWAPEVTTKTSDALIRGSRDRLDERKLALVLIIGIAQDLESSGIDAVVTDAIRYVKTQRDRVYEALSAALDNGLAPTVGKEIYYLAMEEEWPADIASGVIRGILKGQKMGLTPERLGTALIVRVEQELEGQSIDAVVEEEIAFVSRYEKERLDRIQSDAQLKMAVTNPDLWTDLAYTPPPAFDAMPVDAVAVDAKPAPASAADDIEVAQAPPTPAPEAPVAPVSEQSVATTTPESPTVQAEVPSEAPPSSQDAEKPSQDELAVQLKAVHRALLDGSINEYLGTPYKWGGTEKKNGTDCSGFTQGIYRDAGVKIPRVSRVQYKKLPFKLHGLDDLKYGDLVFFNKNGDDDSYITHVGMYLEEDDKGIQRFVHSCCSKGVTRSRFNKRYYLSRFVGAARPGAVEM